jgi:hypothetical protein
MRRVRALIVLALAAATIGFGAPTASSVVPGLPPLATSANVELVANIPGSWDGITFSADGAHAYATGWATGVTVFDLSNPELPLPVGDLPLPHFENEDVEVCGDTLLVANDRVEQDLGGLLHVVDVANPNLPTLLATLPLGLTGEGRGPGHIANFVNKGCTQVWVDGGDDVEVIDLSDRANPRSLGSFKSRAATGPDPENPGAFEVTHDSEVDHKGIVWQTGGGGIAGYRPTRNPLKPLLVASSGTEGVNVDFDDTTSKYNDFILHNSKRMGDTLLVTEEDYVDTDQDQPGSCNGQGKFETWQIKGGANNLKPIDTWQTELNGFVAGGDAEDSKAPVTANCSSHWFEERGGIAAVGWYEQGVRLLDVRNPKDIRQVGYYLPADGATWGAYWVPGNADLIYTADPLRGIDVLRVGNTTTTAKTVTAPILDSWFGTTTTWLPSTSFGYACAIRTR